MTTSVGNLRRGESRRRKREFDEWHCGGPSPAEFRAADQRLARLRAEGASVSEAEVERFLALTTEQVSHEAARVMDALEQRARSNGYAQTEIATEDDDWLKLRMQLRLEGASSVGKLPPEVADAWARRMAAHQRRRLPARDTSGDPPGA